VPKRVFPTLGSTDFAFRHVHPAELVNSFGPAYPTPPEQLQASDTSRHAAEDNVTSAITAADDLEFRYGTDAPTLRVDGMTVAGR